jgi:hypothetical protein
MSNRNAIRQKQRERFMLECFIKAAKLDVQIIDEREAPDFVVRANSQLVGVEVTELFISNDSHGSTAQAKEAISSRIATKAQHLYQAAGGSPAHITVCFAPGLNLRNLNRDKTAEALCHFVLGLNLSLWQRVDRRPEELNGPLPDEISLIHALGVPTFDMAHWGVARAGWVAPLVLSPVQQRIDEKAKRISKYQETISENWLLIVADAMRPSSLIEAKPGFDAQAIVSPFGRTFFCRHPDSFLELGAEK